MKTNITAEQKRMDRQYSRLCQCYSDFETLKQEMAELMVNAATDPAAANKLNSLNEIIPEGISGLEKQVNNDMKALGVEIKKLQSQLNNIAQNR